jgi:hypothetical protein
MLTGADSSFVGMSNVYNCEGVRKEESKRREEEESKKEEGDKKKK